MRKRLFALMVAVAVAAAGCSSNPGEDDHAACAKSLEREQHDVGTRAAAEVASAAGIIKGALDAGRNGRVQQRDQQLLRNAQQRLDRLQGKLDQAFNTGCM